jgi:hypothetical protein
MGGRRYLANDQLPRLTPFSQLDAPGFAWRTEEREEGTQGVQKAIFAFFASWRFTLSGCLLPSESAVNLSQGDRHRLCFSPGLVARRPTRRELGCFRRASEGGVLQVGRTERVQENAAADRR